MNYLPKDPAALLPKPLTPEEERDAKLAGDRWRAGVEARAATSLATLGYPDPLAAAVAEIEAKMTPAQMRAEYRAIREAIPLKLRDSFERAVRGISDTGAWTPARWLLEARKAAKRFRKIGEEWPSDG